MSHPESLTARSEQFDLRTVYETSRLLSGSLDLKFVLDNLLLTAMSKLLVTRGAVLLNDEEADVYRVEAVKGRDKLGANRDLQILFDCDGELLQGDEIPGTLSEKGIALVAPLTYGSRTIGLVALGPKATGKDFDRGELEFIRSLVNMSSTAVHNSQVVEELRRTNLQLDGKIQQLNTLFDISQEFNATVERDRLVKLLSFALMGQMLVNRHLFLVRRDMDSDDFALGESISIVSQKGFDTGVLDKKRLHALCHLEQQLILGDDGQEGDFAWLREQKIALVLPLRHQGATCGMLCLGPKMSGQPYQPDDIEFLFALGNLAFVAIQNSYLVEEQIEKERLEEEMRLAREIQVGLQPQKIPELKGVDIAYLALPSRHVAGDYVDLVPLDDHRLLVAIGDVTGKGVPASLLMSNLQACLHVLQPMAVTLEDATVHMNRVICENTSYDRFITFFHGIITSSDPITFDYVNAGHNPPMLVRKDGTVELLEKGGLLLGVMADAPYERGVASLSSGDSVTMFTDGVTEAMNDDGEEYTEDRLQALLTANREKTAGQIMDAIVNDIRRFTGGAKALDDDLTLVVLKVS